jgi:signal transduction histidine kinase/CheY-like chemotaxis protein
VTALSANVSLTQTAGDQSLEDIITRASMRMRTAQAAKTAPVVLISIVALLISLQGRVSLTHVYWWAALMSGATLARTALCHTLRSRIDTASGGDLVRYERYLFSSAVANAIAIGASFYLVARTGDLTVRLVVTLISCFYGIGTLVNASSHLPSFVIVSSINFGMGIAFWLGLYSNDSMHIEVAFPFLAVALLVIGFGRENSQQFRESLRIRTENVTLLANLATEKKHVEQALQEVRVASESKSRFLAAASHDLRQPLHALTMFLGTLSFHVTTDDARRLLRRIKDTAVVLEEQFNSLLDLSKFDAGAVQAQLAPFRIDRLIERVVEEFRPEAESKHLRLTTTVNPVMAHSDSLLIERVLRNLIGNAVKYTTAGSVGVQLSRVHGELLVEVSDTGRGIPADQQKKVFEEYVQLANPARQRRKGVGLGLAIVRRIDALLGLRLSVTSSVGVGSIFAFHLPLAEQQVLTSQVDVVSLDTTSFRTSSIIWILDDDPDVVEALQEQLLVWGATVKAFSTPAALLEELRRVGTEPPHWILTDDMLGSALSGLETAQILATEFGFVKVCLITGNTEPQRLAQLRGSGFPLLVKPAQPEALMKVIRDHQPPVAA